MKSQDILKNIEEIEKVNKVIMDNYNELSKIKPIKFFEYETMRLLFRLIYNQEKIIRILKVTNRYYIKKMKK